MDFQFSTKSLSVASPTAFLSKNKDTSPASFFSANDNNFNRDQYLNFSDSASPSAQRSNEENESFRVYVRIRPLTSKEQTSQGSKKRPTVIKAEDTRVFPNLKTHHNIV